MSLSKHYGDYGSWPSNAITNPVDAKISDEEVQEIVIGKLSDTLQAALSEGGRQYQFEIGYYATKADGTIVVNSGYKVLSGNSGTEFEITTDQSELGEGSEVKDSSFTGNCQVCIQLFKVDITDGYRKNSAKLTDEEAAELTKLISFDTSAKN